LVTNSKTITGAPIIIRENSSIRLRMNKARYFYSQPLPLNAMVTTSSKNRIYAQLELTSDQQQLIDRVSVLAHEKFAPRAPHYDQTASFPAEDFDDLFRAGLHAPVIPREHGGLGLGPYTDDIFTLWMMTKELAKA